MERLLRMAKRSCEEDMYPPCVEIECDSADDTMPAAARTAKYLCRYLEAQTVRIDDDDRMAGRFRFYACPVPGNIFQRSGFACFRQLLTRFYKKTDDNLTCFEWQHSNPDYGKILNGGIRQFLREIAEARMRYLGQTEHLIYLASMERVCHGILQWAHRCAAEAGNKAEQTVDPRRKAELFAMAQRLRHVPEFPARDFAEAVQCVYFCFHFLPDSLGLVDRYLHPFYQQGLDDGSLTRESAGEWLQELFVMVNGFTPPASGNSDKGGESHFAIGGYLPDHSDGFSDLSRLILESMMKLPLYRPQVSFRWTRKTPFETLRFVLDCERHDRFKRIAVVNDEPRIRTYMEFSGLPFEKACRYVMNGCNEPTFEGTIDLTGCKGNIIRALTDTFANRRSEICEARSFEEFYAIFKEELERVLTAIVDRLNEFNIYRSQDVDVLSSIFIDGCIERAEACNRGGSKSVSVSPTLMGYVTLIDSLTVIRQFVFEEKAVSMRELAEILDRDWQGAELLHARIQKEGRFFGNDDEMSNTIAHLLSESIAEFARGRRDLFGIPILFGNLAGYNPHHAWFGRLTGATPDGRHAGEMLHFGSTPIGGHDREGLTAVLASVAKMDPSGVMNGSHVFNLTLDPKLMEDPVFDKTVRLLETYFRMGGLHLQLNYVGREELEEAQREPDKHGNLRVRVSGFSGYFVRLSEGMQNDVISRTAQE